jgi:hypothetical protein
MKIFQLIKGLLMSLLSIFKSDKSKKTKKSNVKFGYDKNGMPFIDMSDPKTAQVFKKKLEAFEGIKTY